MAKRKNLIRFSGADDIYFTKKNIAVRNVSTWYDDKGKFHLADKTKYYPKTKRNISSAFNVFGYIRNGRH